LICHSDAGFPRYSLKVRRKVLLGVAQDLDDRLSIRQRQRRTISLALFLP